MSKAITTPKVVTPRNKDGKTNAGIPYRYGKSKKSPALKSSAVDMTVLNENELKLMELLKKHKSMAIIDLQDEIFPAKSYDLYGTSDTRNLLRRIGTNATGAKLIERVPGERGVYRLTAKGKKHLTNWKKSGQKAKPAPKKSTKKAPKKASAKKTKKPVAKKAAA